MVLNLSVTFKNQYCRQFIIHVSVHFTQYYYTYEVEICVMIFNTLIMNDVNNNAHSIVIHPYNLIEITYYCSCNAD